MLVVCVCVDALWIQARLIDVEFTPYVSKERCISFDCVQHSIDGCVCLRMCDSGVWCIASTVDWYTSAEASELRIADCLCGVVFTCARNSPVVLFGVLVMGVTF